MKLNNNTAIKISYDISESDFVILQNKLFEKGFKWGSSIVTGINKICDFPVYYRDCKPIRCHITAINISDNHLFFGHYDESIAKNFPSIVAIDYRLLL